MFVKFLECFGIILLAKILYHVYCFIKSVSLNHRVWKRLGDRWIVVTGATDGIGRAIVMKLAKKKKKIIIIGRSLEKLNEVENEAKEKGGEIEKLVMDLSEDIDFDSVIPKDKEIGMLFNIAGVSHEHPKFLPEEEESAIKNILNVNVTNNILLSHCLLKRADKDDYFYLINAGSILGEQPCPLLSVYSSSKTFVKFFSESLSFERIPKKLHAECVLYGMVATKMTKIRTPSLFSPAPEVIAKYTIKTIGSLTTQTPYPPHAIQHFLLSLIPNSIKVVAMLFHLNSVRKKAMKKKKKE
ncbi:Short chain dehydrogenase [Spraguea lophii 42_110]|uniref:Short chain dehydrogenase n=1 Tax=Spraguea lophii (strain 42_110) TaxID=1358809 RepID=S7WAS0_SPRLO|nr:Short chain dehydrogenase [Spraguea lophii 42_110]